MPSKSRLGAPSLPDARRLTVTAVQNPTVTGNSVDFPDTRICLDRIRAEYRQFPGMSLTTAQLGRLLGLSVEHCGSLLSELERQHFLRRTAAERFVLFADTR